MSELQAPVAPQQVQQPPPPPKKKKKKSKAVKTVITVVVLAAVAAVVFFLLYRFVFREEDTQGAAMTQIVMRSSIQSVVEGNGLTRANNSAAVTPAAGGTILELLVQEGDNVTEGQPLYRMDDTEAQQAVDDAQKAVNTCLKEIQTIYDRAKHLTITAPHAGNLRDVADLQIGDTVTEGTVIATLVNDTKLRLSLYYSYAYEDSISVGQSAQISIPATMGTFTGTVETINKVRFVTPEGSVHFEVVFVMDNPGTLSEGMDASAALFAADGAAIYPYENGQLEFYARTTITAKATGPVEQFNLINYADVRSGQLLLRLGAEDNESELTTKQTALSNAQEKLDEAIKNLQNYNAVSPIAGTILSCNLVAGEEVQSGWAITIADTSVMTIEIYVDERNIRYVTPGMFVDIDQFGTYYTGIVESVSMTATSENGVAVFPAVVKVDNPMGLLMSNMNVSYSFVASQSDNCLVVPVQAVKYVSLSGSDGMGLDDGMTDGWDGGSTNDGYPDDGLYLPEDDGYGGTDDVYPEDGYTEDGGGVIITDDSDMIIDDSYDGGMAMPSSHKSGSGAYARPLGMIAIPAEGGSVIVGGSSSGESYGGSTGDGTATIVFVKADTPPANAIEADPSWGCPEGFYPVIVEVGLADNMNVEIISGLNEGDAVFIGYETLNANSFDVYG